MDTHSNVGAGALAYTHPQAPLPQTNCGNQSCDGQETNDVCSADCSLAEIPTVSEEPEESTFSDFTSRSLRYFQTYCERQKTNTKCYLALNYTTYEHTGYKSERKENLDYTKAEESAVVNLNVPMSQ